MRAAALLLIASAALLGGCASVGIGVPLVPGVSLGVGVGSGGVSAGVGTGVGPFGAGLGVNQRGQVTGNVGVGTSTPVGNSGARVGVGVGTGTVLYDPNTSGQTGQSRQSGQPSQRAPVQGSTGSVAAPGTVQRGVVVPSSSVR